MGEWLPVLGSASMILASPHFCF